MRHESMVALYPSRGKLPLYIYEEYRRAGCFLVVVQSSHDISDHVYESETCTLYIPHDRASCEYVLDRLKLYLSFEEIILRQYLEYGAFLLVNVPNYIHHLVILGDTHHLPGLIRDSVRFLSSQKPTVLCSYANPGDAVLVGSILGLSNDRVCLYPPSSIVRNTLEGSLPSLQSLSFKRKTYGLCSRLSLFQIPRSKLIRSILADIPNHHALCLFDFVSDPLSFFQLLLRFSGLIVPSNGSQISPQVLTAAAIGLCVVSDCRFQLMLHNNYNFALNVFQAIHDFDFSTELTFQEYIHGSFINYEFPFLLQHSEVALALGSRDLKLTLDSDLFESKLTDLTSLTVFDFNYFDEVVRIRSSCNPLDLGRHITSVASTTVGRDFQRIRGLLHDF